ncbi:MAG TPA: hypothetical protein VNL14_19930 [Candidatus Acidoferrales bacterium]|nr:hypothetical protein [Candidatus Acidoferrales bacterium]
MNSRDSLSISEKLLLAAYYLEESGRTPFSAEALVVAAWQNFPDAFGLAGHLDENGHLMYPDSNRVFAEIMGSKPIRKRGFLVKVGEKQYQLTEAGREHARLLAARSTRSSVEKAGLARETKEKLKRLLTSKAFEKFRNGRIEDLTFYDACAFWGISPRSSAIELHNQSGNLSAILEVSRKAVQRDAATLEHGGQVYSIRDLDDLLALHKEMQKKFAKEIEVIMERKDERKV